ncbi:MAG: PAS domain-containing protein [Nitrospirota bacterium]
MSADIRTLDKRLKKPPKTQDVSEQSTAGGDLDWEIFFQAIGHPTLILDPGRTILAANQSAINAAGKPLGEILGRKCHEIFHFSDSPSRNCPMETMLGSRRAEPVEAEVEALGRVYVVSCTPVLDQQGHLKSIIHIATDITERKSADQAVKEREKELKARVKELEEFYDMAVGRELRMIQLKKENEGLRRQVEKYRKT